jgi:alkanesulfonate monooxygenase SsuD/methylene tetrahydromethanopterin reductase-like flavin-dependent oxidoreductase (luciferase family)
MKKIGFLSFGHWTPSPQSQTQTAADALLQSIDLAVEAERIGVDGAYFRVHHFARQLASPFPLLAAVGAKTKKIEIGTAVIDMRYENPHYMAEDAGAADLIAGGRLQLGISRGSPEQVIDGWRYFGYQLGEGETDADMSRRHAEKFLDLLGGKGFAQPNTTVVDRRSVTESLVYGSGSGEHGIDAFFAIWTSAADGQRYANRARAGA